MRGGKGREAREFQESLLDLANTRKDQLDGPRRDSLHSYRDAGGVGGASGMRTYLDSYREEQQEIQDAELKRAAKARWRYENSRGVG